MKHIGTTEYVYLPAASEEPIPAKVDTGADGSAIWASSISEQDGVLTFTLFAPQSSFYTGEAMTTTKYKLVNVKNSFGEKEYRYRVTLDMRIARKTYQVSFTLADRSRSRFPILLGKSFLDGRFLVDVARHNIIHEAVINESTGRVIVLTSRMDNDTKDFFAQVAEHAELRVEMYKYKQLTYTIDASGKPHILLPDGSDIASVQTVYFKAHALYPEHAGAIARYLQYRHVNFIDKNVSSFIPRSKLSELFILATSGIPVPATRIFADGITDVTYEELANYFNNSKIVLKDAFGDRGKRNFIVTSEATFQEAVSRLEGHKTIVAQTYIENSGFTRVLVMHDQVAQVIERTSSPHEDDLRAHLNKPFGSANARLVPPREYSADVNTLACRSALTLERTVAGVDLIQDTQTKKWYILEVNYNPELVGGFGTDIKAKAIAKLFVREGRNK